MIRKEVARDADRRRADVEALAEESHEEPHHLGIRVRELEAIAVTCALGPIEHAGRGENWIAETCDRTAVLLILHAFGATGRGLFPGAAHLAVVRHVARGQRSVLLRRELDVPH